MLQLLKPQQGALPNPVVHAWPLPRHSWHEDPDPPEFGLQTCDARQQSVPVVHAPPSGQHSWHVPHWHDWDVLQQGWPSEVHAPPLSTHHWHVPSRHALGELQQPRPLEVHAALFSTQVAVHTLLMHASFELQQSVAKNPVVQLSPRAAQVWHLYAVMPCDVR